MATNLPSHKPSKEDMLDMAGEIKTILLATFSNGDIHLLDTAEKKLIFISSMWTLDTV